MGGNSNRAGKCMSEKNITGSSVVNGLDRLRKDIRSKL